MFSFTEKEKLTFDGSKKKISGQKVLSNILNSRKQQLNEAPKKNMSTKGSVVVEEDLDAICEEGFLHNHEECIKAQKKAMDIDEFLKTVGLKNNDFPMQQSASSSQVAMDDLLSEDEKMNFHGSMRNSAIMTLHLLADHLRNHQTIS